MNLMKPRSACDTHVSSASIVAPVACSATSFVPSYAVDLQLDACRGGGKNKGKKGKTRERGEEKRRREKIRGGRASARELGCLRCLTFA